MGPSRAPYKSPGPYAVASLPHLSGLSVHLSVRLSVRLFVYLISDYIGTIEDKRNPVSGAKNGNLNQTFFRFHKRINLHIADGVSVFERCYVLLHGVGVADVILVVGTSV